MSEDNDEMPGCDADKPRTKVEGESNRSDAGAGAARDGAEPPRLGDETPPLPRLSRLSEDLPVRPSIGTLEREAIAPRFFLVLFFLSFTGLLYILWPFVTDLALSFVLVGMLKRPLAWVSKRIKNPWIASGSVTIFAALALVTPVLLLGYGIAIEAMNAYGVVAEASSGDGGAFVDRLAANIGDLGLPVDHATLVRFFGQSIQELERSVVGWGTSILQNALSTLLHASIILVIVFYLLVDGEKLKKYAFSLSPLPDDEDALLVDTFKRMAKGVVIGNGIGSALQGGLCGVAFWSVGLPSPLLWGAVMTLFASLPLIGVSAVTIPATIYLYATGHIPQAVGFILFCSLVGLTVENIVKTKLMGKTMRMHDLLVFLCILGGIGAFGFAGLLYGPLVAMTYLTLSDLYFARYRSTFAERLRRPHPG